MRLSIQRLLRDPPAMTKDDSSRGLLSRVVKFVRHPATNWSDAAADSADQETEHNKAALKEIVNRRRRNDFVRKREFDRLRTILRQGGTVEAVQDVLPSFFQSSLPSKSDDRAMTLRKIDEIEAQMSMQWWKTKGPDSVPTSGSSLHGGVPSTRRLALQRREAARKAAEMQAEAQRLRGQYTETEASPLTEGPETARDFDHSLPPTVADTVSESSSAPTLPMPLVATAPTVPPAVSSPVRPLMPSPAMPAALASHKSPVAGHTGLMSPPPGGGAAVFSASHFYALDVQEIIQDPEVEEAAIRFANSDDAGAEQGLLKALSTPDGQQRIDDWLALFDFYRASGQLAPFESQAVDFANRFGRSAPQWYDMPAAVAALVGGAPAPACGPSRAMWVSEPELDAHAVGTLQNILARAHQPWVLDWSRIESIDVKAARALLGVFTLWGDQPVALRFVGAGALRERLQHLTPSGRRDVEQLWWELRMAVLRVMNRAEEFELTALDFCVTYELSPPGWEAPRCHFEAITASGTAAEEDGAWLGEVVMEQVPSGVPVESGMGSLGTDFSHLGLVELSGEIHGDPQATLDALERRLEGADVWIISCRHLIRVDFPAAGALLNWVMGLHSQGRLVQFVDVHRLVSAFFHVMGITDHAKVVLRND